MPALIRDGVPVEIFPGEPFADGAGRSYPADWLGLATAAQRAAVPLLDIVEPPPAPDGQRVALTGLARQGGQVVRTYTLSPLTAADLLAYAGTAHNALRDGGVSLSNGMRIKTDAESRGLIGGAYALSDVKPDATIDFKAATGWASIDAATMQTVAIAVGSWVQACYSALRAVEAKIAAGTITAPAQIDAAFAAVTLPG